MSYWWSETSCPDLVDDVDSWSKNLKDTPPIWLQKTRLTAFSSFNQCIGIWDWFRCTEDDSYFTAIVASGQSSAPYAPCFPPVNPTSHDNYVWRVMTFPQSACISYFVFFSNRRSLARETQSGSCSENCKQNRRLPLIITFDIFRCSQFVICWSPKEIEPNLSPVRKALSGETLDKLALPETLKSFDQVWYPGETPSWHPS